MGNVFTNRFNSFCRSLSNLAISVDADKDAPFVLPGTVQNYCLTFDLAWKVMKDVLVKELGIIDFKIGSPREVLKTAYANELIHSDIWLEMLKIRNTLVHDYDGTIAVTNFERIVKEFYPEFCVFRDEIAEYCKDDDMMKSF